MRGVGGGGGAAAPAALLRLFVESPLPARTRAVPCASMLTRAEDGGEAGGGWAAAGAGAAVDDAGIALRAA